MAKSSKKKAPAEDELPFSVHLVRVVSTLLVLGGIVYAALFLVARTQGFASFIEQRIGDAMGFHVTIASTRADWKLNLVAEQVSAVPQDDWTRAGLTVQQVSLNWKLGNLFRRGKPPVERVILTGGAIHFERADDGGWEPRAIGWASDVLKDWGRFDLGLGDTRAAPSAAKAGKAISTAGKRPVHPEQWNCDVVIRNGAIDWWDDRQEVVASIKGIDAALTHFTAPNRTFAHYYMTIDSVRTAPGDEFGLYVELLKTGEYDALLGFSQERKKTAAARNKTPVASPLQHVRRPLQTKPIEVKENEPPPMVTPPDEEVAEAVRDIRSSFEEALEEP